MENIGVLEKKYGWVTFNGRDYILKELMKLTGKIFPDNIVETSADGLDDNNNNHTIYWKMNKDEVGNPDYNKVDRVEKIIHN